MVSGHARIHQPQVTVRAPAEQRHRGLQLVSVLVAACRAAGSPGAGDQQPRVAGEAAPGRPGQVAGRHPDLAALDGGAPDDAGPDPERARGHVGHPLEPHPHRAHERVTLLLGVVPGQVGQLDAEALGVHVETLVVGLGQLDDEVVRHQRAPLGHDGGPVVHLALDRAGYLDRLQLGPEGAREGTLYHAFKTTLEALQYSQRATSLHVPRPRWYPGRGSARGRANLLVARGGWRNGRRARFRSVCPKGREGSNPSSPTSRRMLLGGLRPPSRPTAVLARGTTPRNPPRGPLFGCGVRRWPGPRRLAGSRRWPGSRRWLWLRFSPWLGSRVG